MDKKMNPWCRKSRNHGCLRGGGRVLTVKGHSVACRGSRVHRCGRVTELSKRTLKFVCFTISLIARETNTISECWPLITNVCAQVFRWSTLVSRNHWKTWKRQRAMDREIGHKANTVKSRVQVADRQVFIVKFFQLCRMFENFHRTQRKYTHL